MKLTLDVFVLYVKKILNKVVFKNINFLQQ